VGKNNRGLNAPKFLDHFLYQFICRAEGIISDVEETYLRTQNLSGALGLSSPDSFYLLEGHSRLFPELF
jgi:hypothetical protein